MRTAWRMAVLGAVAAWASGAAAAPPDGPSLRLLSVEAPLSAREGEAVTLTARVQTWNLAGETVNVHLLDDQKPLDITPQKVEKDEEVITVRLRWKAGSTQAPPPGTAAQSQPAQPATAPAAAPRPPLGPGVHGLRVSAGPVQGEQFTLDNHGEVHILVTPPPLRVLGIDTPRPEQRAYRSVLEAMPGVQTAWLLRTPAGRIFSQGRLEGHSITTLPDADDLKRADVVVLGEMEAIQFRPAHLEAIEKFVAGGGGLVALGGRSGLGAGGYGRSPVEAALPAELGTVEPPLLDSFLPRLTEAGLKHPILAGVAAHLNGPGDRAGEPIVLRGERRPLPELTSINDLLRVRPGATVLLERPNTPGWPLLLIGRHGRGRSAILATDSTWAWTGPRAGGDAVHQRLWKQLLAWAGGAENRPEPTQASLVVRADPPWQRMGELVRVRVVVRPLPGSEIEQVRLVVRPEGELSDPALKLRQGEGGTWETAFRVKQMGFLLLTVTAEGYDGKTLASDSLRMWAGASE